MNHFAHTKRAARGYLLVLVLVLGSALLVLMTSLIGYVLGQSRVVAVRYEIQRASDIAEAGLNYYRWYLAHNPNDTTNGTGLPGPYVQQYFDPEGAAIGEFSLRVSSSTYCGTVSSIQVESTGHTYSMPSVRRVISARYVQPTVAEYAYIINSNVWAGPSRTIIGPYHSNGGIRMDGINYSTVSSGQSTWTCDSSFGCSPTGVRNGVFTSTANANQSLFNYPSAPINFTGLTIDMVEMQSKAQTRGGLYFGQTTSGNFGYWITFNSNGTITVRRVTGTTQYWGNPIGGTTDWVQERHHISASTLVGTYTIPASCPLIYVEDKVWIDGVVNQKVTIAAADTDTPGNDRSIILNGNITYSTTTAGLLAVAEQDVLLGIAVPDTMTINGIFVAQNGRYGRNHYCTNCSVGSNNYGLPNSLDQYVLRDSLTLNGTIVSNGRVGEQWVNGSVITSGFETRYNSYDRDLVESPPPLVPNTSDVYVFRDWREEN